MAVVCIGAGALGHLISSRIFPYNSCLIITSHNYVKQKINSAGIIIENGQANCQLNQKSEKTLVPCYSFDDISDIKRKHFNDNSKEILYALICTKGVHSTNLAAEFAVKLFEGRIGTVATLQNGIGYDEMIKKAMFSKEIGVNSSDQNLSFLRGITTMGVIGVR